MHVENTGEGFGLYLAVRAQTVYIITKKHVSKDKETEQEN